MIYNLLTYNPQTEFGAFIKFAVEALLALVIGLVAPVKAWIFFIEFFVCTEWLTSVMVENMNGPYDKRRTGWYMLKKTVVYILVVLNIEVLHTSFFPAVALTQLAVVLILAYQLKLTTVNISELTGVDLFEGVIKVLENLIKKK